jgi:hypothetical protein
VVPLPLDKSLPEVEKCFDKQASAFSPFRWHDGFNQWFEASCKVKECLPNPFAPFSLLPEDFRLVPDVILSGAQSLWLSKEETFAFAGFWPGPKDQGSKL